MKYSAGRKVMYDILVSHDIASMRYMLVSLAVGPSYPVGC